jgi:hypothetical protein
MERASVRHVQNGTSSLWLKRRPRVNSRRGVWNGGKDFEHREVMDMESFFWSKQQARIREGAFTRLLS